MTTIKNLKLRTRSIARHSAISALASADILTGRRANALDVPRIHFPYLHGVPLKEEANFRRLLDALASTHDFVSYSRAIDLLYSGDYSRPQIAFSFDDGFFNNLRAASILEEYGTTGMFFVPTQFIGTEDIRDVRAFFLGRNAVDEPAMSWNDLETLKSRGHEIGNHTANHKVLAWCSPDEAYEEIFQGNRILTSRLGGTPHFAWPRGRFKHMTEQTARQVYRVGHLSCASAERGSHIVQPIDSNLPVCIRRDHIMTAWPVNHSLYFLSRSARNSDPSDNDWPKGWKVGLT